MRTIIKPTMLLISFGLMVGISNAQNKEDASTGKDKTIIIRPDKNSKEKYTIVVDGDKVTINGKPVDEFKGEGIDITQGSASGRYGRLQQGPSLRGGWNMFSPDGMPSGNKALLGVTTEQSQAGAGIKKVSRESAAEKAGLKEGDIITKINETKIETPEALNKAISEFKPEDKITITYSRDGKEYQTTATLTKNTFAATVPGKFFDRKNFDLQNFERGLRNFNMDANKKPRLGIQIQDTENGKGVKVMNITGASAAFKAGLKQEDIITAINGKAVNSVSAVKEELASVKEGDEIKITYLRNNKSQTTTIKFPKKLEKADL